MLGIKRDVSIPLGQGNCVPPTSPGHLIVWMLGPAMARTCALIVEPKLMWFLPPVGVSLGVYDADKVKDLGLPKVQSEPSSVGPYLGGCTVATMSKGSKEEPQKFQMGQILSVVPVTIVNTS